MLSKRRPGVFWSGVAILAASLVARNLWNVPVLEGTLVNLALIVLFVYVIVHALRHG